MVSYDSSIFFHTIIHSNGNHPWNPWFTHAIITPFLFLPSSVTGASWRLSKTLKHPLVLILVHLPLRTILRPVSRKWLSARNPRRVSLLVVVLSRENSLWFDAALLSVLMALAMAMVPTSAMSISCQLCLMYVRLYHWLHLLTILFLLHPRTIYGLPPLATTSIYLFLIARITAFMYNVRFSIDSFVSSPVHYWPRCYSV